MALPPKKRAEIAQLFKGHQKAYETAEGGPWNPPAGDYVCRLCKPVAKQEKTKKPPVQTLSVLRVAWSITDGEDTGREFSDSYNTLKSKQSDNHFGLGRAKALASLIAQKEVEDVVDAISLIYEAALADAYIFKLRVSYNEKSTFPNIQVLDIILPDSGEGAEEASAEGETEPEA